MCEYRKKLSSKDDRNKSVRVIKYLLFSASIIPTIVGGSIALSEGRFLLSTWIVLAIALFIGQMGGDYLYYYFTHFHTDKRDSHTKIFSGWKPLFSSYFSNEKFTLWAGIICLFIDLIIGIYYIITIDYIISFFAVVGGLIALLFTPLMLRGLKEPVIFMTFGPLCVYGVYYALAVKFSFDPVLASIPIGFFVAVVAYLKGAKVEIIKGNNQESIIKLKKKRIIILYALAYISIIVSVVTSVIPFWTILGILSMPIAYLVIKVVKNEKSLLSDYLWAVVKSIMVLIISGIFISIGYNIR